MELKSGDKYIQINSGWKYKVVQASNGEWYFRGLSKKWPSQSCKYPEERIKEMLEAWYKKA